MRRWFVWVAFLGLAGGAMRLIGQAPAAVRNQAVELIRGGTPAATTTATATPTTFRTRRLVSAN